EGVSAGGTVTYIERGNILRAEAPRGYGPCRGFDGRHLLDSQLMHGFRIAIYGGVTANPSPIAVRATREGSERSTCPGLGDILGDQEVAISCSGGNDLPANDRKHRVAGTRCRVPGCQACERRT